jgi:hypothetical protein
VLWRTWVVGALGLVAATVGPLSQKSCNTEDAQPSGLIREPVDHTIKNAKKVPNHPNLRWADRKGYVRPKDGYHWTNEAPNVMGTATEGRPISGGDLSVSKDSDRTGISVKGAPSGTIQQTPPANSGGPNLIINGDYARPAQGYWWVSSHNNGWRRLDCGDLQVTPMSP